MQVQTMSADPPICWKSDHGPHRVARGGEVMTAEGIVKGFWRPLKKDFQFGVTVHAANLSEFLLSQSAVGTVAHDFLEQNVAETVVRAAALAPSAQYEVFHAHASSTPAHTLWYR